MVHSLHFVYGCLIALILGGVGVFFRDRELNTEKLITGLQILRFAGSSDVFMWARSGMPVIRVPNWPIDSKRHANHTALVFKGKQVSYREVDDQAHALAALLRHQFRIKPGDVVLSAFDLRPEGFVVLVACQLLGAIHAPVSPVLDNSEVAAMARNVKPAACVVSSALLEERWRTANSHVLRFDMSNNSHPTSFSTVIPHVWSWGDTMVLVPTSGTTGSPKLVAFPYRAFSSWRRSEPMKILVTAGWESGTLVCQAMMAGILQGSTFVLPSSHSSSKAHASDSAKVWADLIIEHSIQNIVMYPITTLRFVGINTTMPSIRFISLAGQQPNREICAQIVHLFPNAKWYHGYGLTETANVGTGHCILDPKKGAFTHNGFESVGKAVPGVRLKIVEDSSMPRMDHGYLVGEILIRQPMKQFNGYWRDEERTAATLDSEQFIRTGDIGYIDSTNHLYIVSRKDDVIKDRITGRQIWPSVVEAALQSHQQVLSVGVIGERAQDGVGEDVVACVTVDGNASAAALISHAADSLSEWQVPRKIYFMDELVYTKSGKVNRKQLKLNIANR